MAVKSFSPLVARHLAWDPYRVFPELDTRLYYASLDDASTHVIHISDIVCHFAAHFYKPDGIDRDCVVVRSLDQVRLSLQSSHVGGSR